MSSRQSIHDGLVAVIAHSTEPMVISDPHLPDNPIIGLNQAFRDLTGYADAEIAGRNCRFLQGPDTDAPTVQRIGACMRDGQGCIEWIANYRRDGSKFWNLLFISPVFGPGGELLFFFANQHNLSTGLPAGLEDAPMGVAHMDAQQQAEFHALLQDAARDADDARSAETAPARARALEAAVAAAREVAKLSIHLTPGRQDWQEPT